MTHGILEEIQRFFGTRFALPVGSGTVGLAVSLRAVGAAGRRVIVPALACPNVVVAVIAAGAEPIAVDVAESTYDIDPSEVGPAMDDSVIAVVAVDAFGLPSDIQRLRTVVGQRCLVIDDACHAYGGRHDGMAVGARGDIGVISFGYAKPVQLMGGGMLLSDDDRFVDRARGIIEGRAFRRFVTLKNRRALKLMMKDRYREMCEAALNKGLLDYRFPSRPWRRLPGAWRRFASELDETRRNLDAARDLIDRWSGVVPFTREGNDWLPWRYSVKIPDEGSRVEITRAAARCGVRTTRLYRPITDYLDVRTIGELNGTRVLSETTVNFVHPTTREGTARFLGKIKAMAEVMAG